MRHLWRQWASIKRSLNWARHVLLLSDFDGTLAPIVEHSCAATMPVPVRETLCRLNVTPRFSLGFVSGRSLEDLKERICVPRCFYAGNYGLEWQCPDTPPLRSPLAGIVRTALRNTRQRLDQALGHITGVWLEDKHYTLTFHYRSAPGSAMPEVEKGIASLLADLDPRLEAQPGKKSLAIRPAGGWDKGRAVSAIMRYVERTRGTPPLVIYMGDDQCDEPAFAAAAKNGYAVFVGRPNITSRANCYLDDPDEVAEFLNEIERCLSGCTSEEFQSGSLACSPPAVPFSMA